MTETQPVYVARVLNSLEAVKEKLATAFYEVGITSASVGRCGRLRL